MNTRTRTRFPFRLIFLILLISLLSTFTLSFLIVNFRNADSIMSVSQSLIVVPGAGITRSSRPSPALKKRLDKAIDIYYSGKSNKIYISGTFYEVFAMNKYLTDLQISSNSIVIDDKGVNTYQTVDNVATYLRDNQLTDVPVFISQRYHLPRISLFSHRQKLKNVTLLAADHIDVKAESRSHFILRETLAYFKALWLNH